MPRVGEAAATSGAETTKGRHTRRLHRKEVPFALRRGLACSLLQPHVADAMAGNQKDSLPSHSELGPRPWQPHGGSGSTDTRPLQWGKGCTIIEASLASIPQRGCAAPTPIGKDRRESACRRHIRTHGRSVHGRGTRWNGRPGQRGASPDHRASDGEGQGELSRYPGPVGQGAGLRGAGGPPPRGGGLRQRHRPDSR